jgi:UDP-N-acetylmuramoyl-tripeptide--D-alanyl-D-alanine ligase
MKAALDFCDAAKTAGRKIYVIGEMLELGKESEAFHNALFKRLSESKASQTFFYRVKDDWAEFKNNVVSNLRDGDMVLLKGSRACALERILEGMCC